MVINRDYWELMEDLKYPLIPINPNNPHLSPLGINGSKINPHQSPLANNLPYPEYITFVVFL